MTKRLVRLTLEVLGETDREGWDWGEAIARTLRTEIADDGEGWFVAVQCLDVEDPARAATPEGHDAG